ncbi:MAG: lamin tail domain-containing protein, partial [Verrucomicrobia bacterium]|nr:lamin tail domain-containing protein [Verrucomicrobiota bacterium]
KPGNAILKIYPPRAGDIYLDDIMIVPGAVAGVGSNFVRNGDFETPLDTNTWSYTKTAASNSTTSTLYAHSGASSLHLVFNDVGSSVAYFYQNISNIAIGVTNTLSFWYLPTTTLTNVLFTMGGLFQANIYVRPVFSSPGAANSVAGTVPPYPLLWLNEVQPNNPDGYRDNTGTAQPWLELFNSGTNALSLSNYFLANNYTNLSQWAFPSNLVIGPTNFLVVFADGQPQLSSGAVLHTSFRLDPASGSVALSSAQRLLDYINYSNVPPRYSYGSAPDGQLVDRDPFFYPTPGASNNPALPPARVVINEWMAGNTHTILNSATLKYDDWFELYNYGTNAADLSGYYLTQALTNKTKFQIPSGCVIPPGGFLLVWADNKSAANGTNVPDLHVNFKLTKAGDSIGLFTPDGTMIDAISFTNMTSDLGAGRYPDGAINIYPMVIPTPRGSNVLPINHPPVLDAIPDATGAAGALLTFSASASDPDVPRQSLTFSLDPGAPPGATIDPFSGDFVWNIPLDFTGTWPITVRVTDNGIPASSAAQIFTITVSSGNRPPVIALIPTQYVDELTPLSLPIPASDPEAPPQTLSFNLIAPPVGASVDGTGLFAWTPTEAQGPSTNLITVVVTDSGVPPLSATQSFTVIVREVNTAPVLAPIPNRTLHAGMALVFTNQATDSDLPPNVLAYSLSNAPSGASLGTTSGVFAWTPAEAQIGSTNFVTVIVSDDGLTPMSDQQTFRLIVAARPSLQIISTNGTVALTWSAIPGQVYRVQQTDQLNPASWTDLPGEVTAVGDTASKTDPMDALSQRFYRILVRP